MFVSSTTEIHQERVSVNGDDTWQRAFILLIYIKELKVFIHLKCHVARLLSYNGKDHNNRSTRSQLFKPGCDRQSATGSTEDKRFSVHLVINVNTVSHLVASKGACVKAAEAHG